MVEGYKYGKPYYARLLEISSSSEWMAESKKRYRRIFDRQEIRYLYFTFSFINKLFDEEDWEAEITLEILNSKNKSLTQLSEKVKITKDQNEYFHYDSWGNKNQGSYWLADEYRINAYIDNELVKSEKFRIYDMGQVTSTYNPYFDVVSFKVFENNKDMSDPAKYLKVFQKDNTRYVWIELKIKNKMKSEWDMEYFVNFYDDAGQPKAVIRDTKKIKRKKGETVIINNGWGNESGKNWMDDKYIVNFVFMDVLVATNHFEIGEEIVEGTNEVIGSDFQNIIHKQVAETEDEDALTLDELMGKINELIGLDNVKKQITEYINYLDFLKLRKEKGIEEEETLSLHSVFTGNPGTGKTTIVRYLAKIYHKMGLLSKGHLIEADRSQLVGEFIGQTAPKVKKLIDEARGGVLFIDEAYALFREGTDEKDFGREVIEILIKEMSDGPGDIAIMYAGYPKEMDAFVNSNPGLKSRISYYFNFPDYNPEELMRIAYYAANKKNLEIDTQAVAIIEKVIERAYRDRDRTFGNARFVYSIINSAKMNMGVRIMKQIKNGEAVDDKELKLLKKEDFDEFLVRDLKKKVNFKIDESLLNEALSELNSLIGLEKIKQDVSELIKLVKYYHEIGRDVVESFSVHTVFTGNPGTGKTTIARIMGKVYKALGLLEKGHLVEVSQEGLIAGYIGQTAIKTQKVVDQAMGGVLFIDEAYGLTATKFSYGGEAVQVLLKNMEDHRGKFALIVAGYPDEMNTFLHTNPGLMSRFDRTFHFKDYNKEDLMLIAKKFLTDHNLYFNEEASKYFDKYLEESLKTRDKYYGNAREMRRLVETIVRKQNLRVADIPSEKRTTDDIIYIKLEDLDNLIIEKPKANSLGFNK